MSPSSDGRGPRHSCDELSNSSSKVVPFCGKLTKVSSVAEKNSWLSISSLDPSPGAESGREARRREAIEFEAGRGEVNGFDAGRGAANGCKAGSREANRFEADGCAAGVRAAG